MKEMLLDRVGDALIPPGYQLVDSEVAFLQQAISGKPLLVRGSQLCQWAETFWNGRNIPYSELLSPTQTLHELVPSLSEAEAQAIYAALSEDILTKLGKVNLTELLQLRFPNALWQERPSKEHAANWLLWLYEYAPNTVFEPLLAENGRFWQREVDDATYAIYATTNAVQASQLLDSWLGLTHDPMLIELGVFPHKLTDRLRAHVITLLKDQVITQRGALFSELETQPIQPDLLRLAAQETVNYLVYNPRHLTTTLRDQLVPYLTLEGQNRILGLMPPDMPEALPEQPEAVLSWFRYQYLPARQWQAVHGSDADRLKIRVVAEQFAHWYLDQYPRALNGSPLQRHLSFIRAASSQQQNSHVTLCIVLDGLHALDARQLLEQLQQQTKRLTVWEDGLAFTPLPTVTEVCKPALFAGVLPILAQNVTTLGTVVPENSSPIENLNGASPGELYLWRILEPDRTYHRQNSSETLRHDIDGRLSSVANKIKEIVSQVPTELPLRLIITSDHGRLLAKATRTLNVPVGMQSQGRTALGSSGRQFNECGFIIENDIVYLHAGRFGLPDDAAVAFSEDTFRTNDGKTGSEWYPHGGLYPEEVIVPWIELVRDMILPEVTVKLSGTGQAGQYGDLTLQLCNPGDVPITASDLTMLINGKQSTLQINQVVSPYDEQTFVLKWSPWPNKAEIENMVVELNLQLPNALSFVVAVTNLKLESIEMYRRDNILGDLDL